MMNRILVALLFASSALAQTLQRPQQSFIGGELSPLMVTRTDSPRYDSGCRTLENALVLDVGVAARRPGTVYVVEAPGVARLETFVYDENDTYIMEFTDKLLRFYRDGGIVLNGGSAYTVATPWAADDLFDFKVYQKGDVLYVAHRSYSPRKITRSSHTSWTIQDCNALITDGPFKDENTDTSITIDPPNTPSDATTGQTFDANDVYLTYTAAKAFDDVVSAGKQWGCQEVNDTWIRCRFASPKTITRVKIWACGNSAAPSQNVRHCKIEASNNGTDWTKLSVERWYGRCQGYNGDEIEISEYANYTDYALVYLTNTTAYSQYRVWCYDNWGSATYLNINEIEMTESSSGTFTSSSSLFTAGHVGSIWKLRHPRTQSEVSGTFTGYTQWSNSIRVEGAWDLTQTGSSWAGTIVLQRSYDFGATWENYRTWDSTQVIDATGTEDESNVWYRLNVTAYTSGSCTYSLSCREGTASGIIRVTAYTNPTTVTATVLSELESTDPTYRWSEGAWSKDEGYPDAVAGHQSRLVFAKNLSMWWSKAYYFESFAAGVNDDDSFSFTLSQKRLSPIRWLVGDRGQALIAGTSGRVMEIHPMDELNGFSPTNPPKVRSSTAVGAAKIEPALSEDMVLYADAQRKRVYEMGYSSSSDSVGASDLTLLASHVTGTGIVQMDMQSNAYPILWCVRADGEIASLYYSRAYQIVAWSRQVTDGNFTSVAVTPREGYPDRVWTVVQRYVNGSNHYYVEYFADVDFDADIQDCFYVDSGLKTDANTAVVPVTIAKSATATITLGTGKYSNGDQVRITDVEGMTEVNDVVYMLKGRTFVTPNYRYDLYDSGGTTRINTSSYGTFTGGGLVRRVENVFGGLSHLEGETVAILADGAYYGTEVVASGSITLDDFYNYDEVVIGLPYRTTITPVGIDLLSGSASTIPFRKREVALYVDVYRTTSGKYGPNVNTLKEIGFPRSSTASLSAIPELYTGDWTVRTMGPSRKSAGYTLVQDDPFPFIVRSMLTLYEANQ